MDPEHTRRRVLALVGGSILPLAGCTGDQDDSGETPSETPSDVPSTETETDREPTDTPTRTADTDTPTPTAVPLESFSFTSFPDLFNWNIKYPQEGWEDAMDWFLGRMKEEGPAFSLNAGDLMDARWWESTEQVREKTDQYWGGLDQRMTDKDIDMYYAPGDHEYGDNGGLPKYDLNEVFAEQFVDIFEMPKNGPEHKEGRAYSFEEQNLYVISVDTFQFPWEGEVDEWTMLLGDKQRDWLEGELQSASDRDDIDFIIVQGHEPVIREGVTSRTSSADFLDEGPDGKFWQLMAEYNVDAYFCGEHHDISVNRKDGVWQIVHGAIWGSNSPVSYLRGHLDHREYRFDQLELDLFEFPVEYSDEQIYPEQHPNRDRGPAASVSIPQDVKENGPENVGSLVFEARDGPNEIVERAGVFE